jgi:hypothetical protein
MKIDGACHCGVITYEAEIDLATVVICHCTDCQALSGSTFRSLVPARKDAFKVITGEPKVYIKTAESGNKSAQTFCADCGSGIYSSAATDPQIFMIRVGTSRQRAELRPKSQWWCQSALEWVSDAWPTDRLEKQPTH